MEIQRTLIILGIAVVSYMLILSWQQDYVGVEQPQATEPAPVQEPEMPSPQTAADDGSVPGVEDAPPVSSMSAPAPDATPEPEAVADERLISVTTDVLQVDISPRGGDIVRLALPGYPKSAKTPDQPFVLMQRGPERTYVAQSGLVGQNGTDSAEGRPVWRVEKSEWTLDGNDRELNVDLRLVQDNGAEIIKRYTFERGSYLIRLSHIIRNHGDTAWKGHLYGQIKRDGSSDPGSERGGFAPMPTFMGAAWWTEEQKYNKLDLDDIQDDPIKTTQPGGWIAMVQHYFVSAWVPEQDKQHSYQTLYRKASDNYLLRFLSPQETVEPGEEKVLYTELYSGPKIQDRLEAISPGLNMTVDYGWLWFISEPIFHVLVFLQSGELDLFGLELDLGVGVGNWGVAIILLTLLIKLVFFKLSATSYRSMAKMRKVAPEMQRIKEQNKNDRQKQSQELMKLYQKEKINPLGGCLPILVQMPVFIALYYVLLESVELRQAPFFGWIQDLSIMDPYFVLPLLMGASMFLQTRLNPTPPDPTQAQIMKWMPVVFTVFFLWFPAGLVLYWLTNNLLSIAQQYVITRNIEREG